MMLSASCKAVQEAGTLFFSSPRARTTLARFACLFSIGVAKILLCDREAK